MCGSIWSSGAAVWLSLLDRPGRPLIRSSYLAKRTVGGGFRSISRIEVMSDVVVDTADGQSFRHADGRWILNQGA